ncbi:DUF427-domain-containing protein [Gautieria morchelliformis]|nr:DUF427-domain-containing protein [Gautieria morchelliformis]
MVQVILQGKVLADSNKTVVVENNHYFPPESVSELLTKDSTTTTFCPWKGTAHYYNVGVDGKTVTDVAWYYPEPYKAADNIRDYVAFYKNKVEIKE